MPANVQGGNLGRWFEQLCRIKYDQLGQIVASTRRALAAGALPHEGGVYAFWWTGDRGLLRGEDCVRLLQLHGPGGRPVRLEMDDETTFQEARRGHAKRSLADDRR
jgi:hypothetical protein